MNGWERQSQLPPHHLQTFVSIRMNDAEVYICTIKMNRGSFVLLLVMLFLVSMFVIWFFMIHDQLKASSPRRL